MGAETTLDGESWSSESLPSSGRAFPSAVLQLAGKARPPVLWAQSPAVVLVQPRCAWGSPDPPGFEPQTSRKRRDGRVLGVQPWREMLVLWAP